MSRWLALIALIVTPTMLPAETIDLDERPAGSSDWGYRPHDRGFSATNPPSFCWRPQGKISQWEVRCRPASGDKGTDYHHDGIRWNVHCPSSLFHPGEYRWQYRGLDDRDQHTKWSKERTVTIPKSAAAMPFGQVANDSVRFPDHPVGIADHRNPGMRIQRQEFGRLQITGIAANLVMPIVEFELRQDPEYLLHVVCVFATPQFYHQSTPPWSEISPSIRI